MRSGTMVGCSIATDGIAGTCAMAGDGSGCGGITCATVGGVGTSGGASCCGTGTGGAAGIGGSDTAVADSAGAYTNAKVLTADNGSGGTVSLTRITAADSTAACAAKDSKMRCQRTEPLRVMTIGRDARNPVPTARTRGNSHVGETSRMPPHALAPTRI
jgi:hypothetical protein